MFGRLGSLPSDERRYRPQSVERGVTNVVNSKKSLFNEHRESLGNVLNTGNFIAFDEWVARRKRL